MSGEELIARLEKLSGPDRAIDAAIWELVDPEAFAVTKSHRRAFTNRDWTPEEQTREATSKAREYAPYYTASIDAALTLVPDGFSYHINFGRHIGGASCWLCPEGPDSGGVADPRSADGNHSHAAIALCIAALRSRASKDGGGE